MKLTLRQMARTRRLEHRHDEAEGLAAEALLKAAHAWQPSRSRFPWFLRYYVRMEVRTFRHHGARVVHVSEREYYRNGRVKDGLGEAVPLDEGLAAVMPGPAQDVDGLLDSARLLRRVRGEVSRRLLAARPATAARRRIVAESVGLWVERTLEGAPLESLASRMGVSRQAVDQRIARVQVAFESWAAEVRGEVAP
ncbi:hypothetical protein [Corallococcus silvisoli]|uniref:hypothetical protein n=1 Tax=Corallococcus silvisoli TaxID=2697031 RepID=UPI001376E7A5|nr:hypothetical protein [Corallococcus silvisoli]NBD11817.1 hypothetical protein [Corallococcus silvisoli]